MLSRSLDSVVRFLLAALALALAPVLAHSGGHCTPGWKSAFGGMPGLASGGAYTACSYDDGSGPALYVSGSFLSAGGIEAQKLARWDGQDWHTADGTSGFLASTFYIVRALAVFDAGSGPALYAAGDAASGGAVVARLDAQGWSIVASGPSGLVMSLAVVDLGGGASLYAGGNFTSLGGVAANGIARYDGSAWHALGGGVTGLTNAIAGYDDGAGAELYVAGTFLSVEGQPTPCQLARWNGGAWIAMPFVFTEIDEYSPIAVQCLATYDDGSGARLYIAGRFAKVDGIVCNSIASYSGGAIQPLVHPGGIGIGNLSFLSPVSALRVLDVGSGPRLFVCSPLLLSTWDGTALPAFPGAVFSVGDALLHDDGGGSALHVVGGFIEAGSALAYHVARYDGLSWHALGDGLDGAVRATIVHTDATGTALYAAGSFRNANGVELDCVGRWNGQAWQPLGAGLQWTNGGPGVVYALASHDDGSGPALYAGGAFVQSGAQPLASIARWNGTSWSPLGAGLGQGATVHALAVQDFGSGKHLYAAGVFTTFVGAPANWIARWDGTSWSAVGAGLNGEVRALKSYVSGGLPRLAAGGKFTQAGGQDAQRIASFDGTSWSALGSGVAHSLSNFPQVFALATHDFGAGPELVAAGYFNLAGGASANYVARWNGVAWSSVGAGLGGQINCLTEHASATGSELYAGGVFFSPFPNQPNRLARFDGTTWQQVGTANVGLPYHLASHPQVGALGAALYVGGDIASSPTGDSFLLRWGCPDPTGIASAGGCVPKTAQLSSLSSSLQLGQSFACALTDASVGSGLALLFAGANGANPSGCGLALPGIGEVLLALAPTPLQLATAPLVAGKASFALPPLSDPQLVGITVGVQGARIASPSLAVELSNALQATVQP